MDVDILLGYFFIKSHTKNAHSVDFIPSNIAVFKVRGDNVKQFSQLLYIYTGTLIML